jgi:DNA primase
MLPHVRDRPATRKRWPDGVGEVKGKPPTVFFNKDLAAVRRIGCHAAPLRTEITTTTTQ